MAKISDSLSFTFLVRSTLFCSFVCYCFGGFVNKRFFLNTFKQKVGVVCVETVNTLLDFDSHYDELCLPIMMVMMIEIFKFEI